MYIFTPKTKILKENKTNAIYKIWFKIERTGDNESIHTCTMYISNNLD